MITAAVVFHLERDSQSQDRDAVGRLYGIPDGQRVDLRVGSRDFVPPWTADQIGQYVATLHFHVEAETWTAAEAWTRALRQGAAGLAWSA